MNLLEVITRAKAERDFNVLVEVMPYARFLGLSAEERDGEVVSKLAFDDKLIGNPVLPALHGGVVGALLEHAALIHLMWELEITTSTCQP